jgi:hypothetical protein
VLVVVTLLMIHLQSISKACWYAVAPLGLIGVVLFPRVQRAISLQAMLGFIACSA